MVNLGCPKLTYYSDWNILEIRFGSRRLTCHISQTFWFEKLSLDEQFLLLKFNFTKMAVSKQHSRLMKSKILDAMTKSFCLKTFQRQIKKTLGFRLKKTQIKKISLIPFLIYLHFLALPLLFNRVQINNFTVETVHRFFKDTHNFFII